MSAIWDTLVQESKRVIEREPLMESYISVTILHHATMGEALAHYLAGKLSTPFFSHTAWFQIFMDAITHDTKIPTAIEEDLTAILQRDPASQTLLNPFLNYKGYHALQSHRVAHWLWVNSRNELAFLLQSLVSKIFAIDIHPAAQIGLRCFIDHGTSIVIGETAVIGNDVSMLHEVTLGGTGKEKGDRHPKIGHGVLIGAGAKILGNIRIGDGAIIGAGSVVLKDIQAHTTVVGVPAREVGKPKDEIPAIAMDHMVDTLNQP